MHKLYGDRVCHFAHHPDTKGIAPRCERRHVGTDSADHLYIHRGLTHQLGKSASPQRFQGTMVNGQCTDLLVNASQGRAAIKVQFMHLSRDAWTKKDEELRSRLGQVDWVIGPYAAETTEYLLDRNGYALRVRCEHEGSTRVVRVGTETREGDLEWSRLDECEINEQGIVTPPLRKIRRIAERKVPEVMQYPGLPLTVKKIVIYPSEHSTRPAEGADGFHATAATVRVAESEPMHAWIMLPTPAKLVVGEPYSLREPASVDVTRNPGHSPRIWTIFSPGLLPIRPAEQTSVSPSRLRQPGTTPPLIRNKLSSLIQDMRRARKAGDYEHIIQTLTDNADLLNI
ncbi:hypothetical protein [Spongiactinospora rosea]|uniref:hypothetical protein n=1 Tax=Spongiactinospora rosea TaxID=2248750 RepID=UPI0011C051C9|nr:hypothetical protein [Spongiactinospora rosea]